MNQDAVDLVLLGMQQNRAALAASVIHGLVTGFENGRRFQGDTHWWRGDQFKTELLGGHNMLPVQAGALPDSQSPTPGAEPLPVMPST